MILLVRRGREKPSLGVIRCDLRGPHQYREACRRRRNLAIIPFRDGINMGKMKKPLRRVIEPAVTIGLVIVAFIFIPWLSSGLAAKGNIAERFRSSARTSRRR